MFKKGTFLKKYIFYTTFIVFMYSIISFADDQYITNNYYYYGNYNNPYSNNGEYYYISSFYEYGNEYYNGEAMFGRRPIFSGVNQYYVGVANNLIFNCYNSIQKYCTNEFNGKYQGFYLNGAYIEKQNSGMITLIVNCALKKNAIISNYAEFRVSLDLVSNRFNWTRIDNLNKKKKKLLE